MKGSYTVDFRVFVHIKEPFADGLSIFHLVRPRNDNRQKWNFPRSRIVDFVAVKQRLPDFVTVLDGRLDFATEKDLLRTAESK